MNVTNQNSPSKNPPPLSPSKRGCNSLASESKRQRIQETAHQLIGSKTKKPLSEADQRILDKVKAIKSKKPKELPKLIHFIEKKDIEGLKAAFNPLNYHSDNIEGIEELKDAVYEIRYSSDNNKLNVAFAELLIQIEDLSLLTEKEFISYFKGVTLPKEHPNLALRLLCNDMTSLTLDHKLALQTFRTPIKNYTLLDYAAHFVKTEPYLKLVELGLDPIKVNFEGNISLHVLLSNLGSSRKTPSDLAAFFQGIYPYDTLPDPIARLTACGLFLGDLISLQNYQFIPLILNEMIRWKGPWEDWKEEIVPHLTIDDSAIGKYALLESLDQNFDLDRVDSNQHNLLHWAVVLQNIPLIKKLLPTNIRSQLDLNGRSALHLAATIPGMNPRIFKLLLKDATQDELKEDDSGYSPLDLALDGDLYENFHVLNQLGLSPSASISDEKWFAATNNVDHFKEQLKSTKLSLHSQKLLHFAVALGHKMIINECLKLTINWHQPDSYGYTPLALAVKKGDLETISIIYDHQTQFSPPSNKEAVIDLIQISLKHPVAIDEMLKRLPVSTLFEPNENGWNTLGLVEFFGGKRLSLNLLQSHLRLQNEEFYSS